MFAVSVEPAGDGLRVGTERKLFAWNVDFNREFAVAKDGVFYAIEAMLDAPKQTVIRLRTHWLDELVRLVGDGAPSGFR